MSHYAKIITPIDGWILSMPARLAPGTEIKHVTVNQGGFSCSARLAIAGTGDRKPKTMWYRFVTQADLPAFTDKGIAQRAAGSRSELRKGRPATKGRNTATTGIRLRRDQLEALRSRCSAAGKTVNEAIVDALVLSKLVPQ
jgi:hypothetical protein